MTHPDVDRFDRLYRLADKLIGEASKEELAEAARILALNLTPYQARHGELHAVECLSLAAQDHLTPELANTLADGMAVLVDGLGSLAREETRDDAVH